MATFRFLLFANSFRLLLAEHFANYDQVVTHFVSRLRFTQMPPVGNVQAFHVAALRSPLGFAEPILSKN